MPVSGLLLTLDPASAHHVRAVLSLDSRLTLGESAPDAPWRLPVVLDTDSAAADQAAWDDLRQTQGVTHIDVTSIFFI